MPGKQLGKKRSLAAYRLVFGQPHQEDLPAHLAEGLTLEEARKAADLWRISLELLKRHKMVPLASVVIQLFKDLNVGYGCILSLVVGSVTFDERNRFPDRRHP